MSRISSQGIQSDDASSHSKANDVESQSVSPPNRSIRIRFSLRTFLTMVFVLCVLFSLLKWFGTQFFLRVFSNAIHHLPFGDQLVPAACFLGSASVCWIAVRHFEWTVRRSWVSASLFAFALLAIIAVGDAVWARHRVDYYAIEPTSPWFYPDWAVIRIYDWSDARKDPGQLKMHGEWPDVRFILDIVICGLAGISGVFCGTLAAAIPAGLWRKKSVSAKSVLRPSMFQRHKLWGVRFVI
jgi:hypothetical protein